MNRLSGFFSSAKFKFSNEGRSTSGERLAVDELVRVAAKNGDIGILHKLSRQYSKRKLLLAVNSKSKSSPARTALHDAAEQGHLEVVKFLVQQLQAQISCEDSLKRTPLYLASASGHLEIVKLLISWGADISACDSYPGHTPLHEAAFHGHVEVVKVLLSSGVDVSATQRLALFIILPFFWLLMRGIWRLLNFCFHTAQISLLRLIKAKPRCIWQPLEVIWKLFNCWLQPGLI
eukprot:TRINITY_DN6649_c0_g1_i1.p1 TRINITY_DN6649_c0_g1~~TRINITY_DN6649_c0_g1_i1.p1  ORF type:complete len:233 (-),score=18.20 TRINITY_DN6649_c0_g1_i1:194-892(-)